MRRINRSGFFSAAPLVSQELRAKGAEQLWSSCMFKQLTPPKACVRVVTRGNPWEANSSLNPAGD